MEPQEAASGKRGVWEQNAPEERACSAHTCWHFKCHPSARQDLVQGPLSSQQCPDPGESSLPKEGGTSLHGGQVSLNYSKDDLWNDLNF